mmetsp:Transcript_20934/g.34568  ORF Transcript_20934/g.34568 Transcript_20934/m.34568 type:complete len:361 (-) Transcript_20934:457-1539(-)|eukprot:CAMPEP_0119300594 /NCGR_PEP_ID=MMETSP1333-20130426/2518_1 /TAXON_ID=418940 /ORGANISM="Scyphosphaera apsteinii, Strain RCC1455" /LENGTH=360 /DNA_ID=CAMNT_0007302421 /DNA_START=349 /DNA_END=1431 /DNA_ORIENTATION=-
MRAETAVSATGTEATNRFKEPAGIAPATTLRKDTKTGAAPGTASRKDMDTGTAPATTLREDTDTGTATAAAWRKDTDSVLEGEVARAVVSKALIQGEVTLSQLAKAYTRAAKRAGVQPRKPVRPPPIDRHADITNRVSVGFHFASKTSVDSAGVAVSVTRPTDSGLKLIWRRREFMSTDDDDTYREATGPIRSFVAGFRALLIGLKYALEQIDESSDRWWRERGELPPMLAVCGDGDFLRVFKVSHKPHKLLAPLRKRANSMFKQLERKGWNYVLVETEIGDNQEATYFAEKSLNTRSSYTTEGGQFDSDATVEPNLIKRVLALPNRSPTTRLAAKLAMDLDDTNKASVETGEITVELQR